MGGGGTGGGNTTGASALGGVQVRVCFVLPCCSCLDQERHTTRTPSFCSHPHFTPKTRQYPRPLASLALSEGVTALAWRVDVPHVLVYGTVRCTNNTQRMMLIFIQTYVIRTRRTNTNTSHPPQQQTTTTTTTTLTPAHPQIIPKNQASRWLRVHDMRGSTPGNALSICAHARNVQVCIYRYMYIHVCIRSRWMDVDPSTYTQPSMHIPNQPLTNMPR